MRRDITDQSKPALLLQTDVAVLRAVSHHAAVEVLVHLAEGVRRRLPLAGDDDAHIRDSQRSVGLALGCAAVGDVDAL